MCEPSGHPLRNRATPLGEVIAAPARGLVYANRGCLHDDRGRIRRRFAGRRWIACRLHFRGRRRSRLMAPGRYTELFFTDEAAALAAGHRPCAECRRDDYNRFCSLWRDLHPGPCTADAIDLRLHAERVDPRTRGQRHHQGDFDELPDGTFVLIGGAAWLLVGDELLAWTPTGYAARRARPRRERALVITPPSLVSILAAGWAGSVPLLHPSASAARR